MVYSVVQLILVTIFIFFDVSFILFIFSSFFWEVRFNSAGHCYNLSI